MSSTVVQVNVRNLAVGGSGVGEIVAQSDGYSDLLGITAFVPFTAIGERVSARVVQRKDRYVRTELAAVEQPSLERVQPGCPVFTTCGGCELQHLSYPAQLQAKRSMIQGALRAAQLPLAIVDAVEPLVESSDYGYRRRVTLHVDAGGNVGFYREASRSVVPIADCPISVPAIRELLPSLQGLGAAVRGRITSVLLESDANGIVAVLKSPYDLGKNEIQSVTEIAKRFFSDAVIFAGEREVGGFGRQILELPLNFQRTLMLRVPAGYFSQVNASVNVALIERLVREAAVQLDTPILDLYAGGGNFSLPLARAGAKVTAVETDRRLVQLGRENAGRYNVQRKLEFANISVERFLKQLASVPKVLVADPPRSGLGSLAGSLPASERLLLVSCHLPSCVRDMKSLLDIGWDVEAIVPFDMFAQTSYVEVLTVFRRR